MRFQCGHTTARVFIAPDAEYIFATELVLVRIEGGLAYFGFAVPDLNANLSEIEASKVVVLPRDAVLPSVWLILAQLGEKAMSEIRRFTNNFH